MSKKIVVISSSFRKEGNTQALVNEFISGAEDAGNDVETINLRDINWSFAEDVCIVRKTKRTAL